jgi:hypothetical protein
MIAAAILVGILPVAVILGMAKPVVVEVPAGPTDDERLGLLAEQRSLAWGYLLEQYPTLSRPATEVVAILSGDDWERAVENCVEVATPEYADSGGAEMWVQMSGDGPFLVTTDVAYQVCIDSYPNSATLDYLLNDAQIGYIYDYYVTWVAPCLARNGYVSLNAPGREEFITNFYVGGWSPYSSVGLDSGGPMTEIMNAECSPEPPGLFDSVRG